MSTAPTPRALVFDVMGTVVDDVGTERSAAVAAVRRHGGSTEQSGLDLAAAATRRLGDLMADVNAGGRPWASHRDLRREAVRVAAGDLGLQLTTDDEAQLSSVTERFDPWPDSPAGLDQLRRLRLVVALTNADPDELADLSLRGGLSWHLALSTRPSQAYKPDPRAYEVAVDALDLRPEQIMMVAAHDWDLRAAAELGMRTCYVRRPFQDHPAEDEFDLMVDDLPDLAEALGTT